MGSKISFVCMEKVLYLCGMLYLKTKTDDMTTPAIRRVVCEAIKWCEANVGSRKKYRTLKYKVRTDSNVMDVSYGMYDPAINTITIHRNVCLDVKTVVRVVIHEYTHFLQNLKKYDKVLKKVGYRKHPLEVEARGMETLYSICWNDIKNNL